jgi:hypothetical protein
MKNQPAERRQAIRYAYPLRVTCKSITPGTIRSWPAQARDISLTGIGLVLHQQVEPGTLIEVHIQSLGGKLTVTRLLLVIYAKSAADSDWHLGGTFYRELAFEEIKALSR